MTDYKQLLQLMDTSFRTEPFHTLNLILGSSYNHKVPGGTCSDKSLSFKRLAREHGFDAYLHNAYIGDVDCHRLVRIELDGLVYFADVGNGWPAIVPYPSHKSIEYTAFGMHFRSVICSEFVSVFHKIQDEEKPMVRIPIKPKSEEEIMRDITHRFSEGTVYPFSGKMRFSAVSGNEFLFLKGTSFRRYCQDRNHCVVSVSEGEWFTIIETNFGWKV